MEVTTTTTKAGKFDARFYDLIFEEEIGRVKGHFGPINSLAFHPDGKRLVLWNVYFFVCWSQICKLFSNRIMIEL